MFTVEVVKIEAIIGAKKWVIGINWNFGTLSTPGILFIERGKIFFHGIFSFSLLTFWVFGMKNPL